MLHPNLDEVIARIRKRGIVATVITNGYPLTNKRIAGLNAAGLDYLQISIDNINPDEFSMKSLKVLDQKLTLLSGHAKFGVNANAVIGAGISEPEAALAVADRAKELVFNASLGILHDGQGRMKPVDERERVVYRKIKKGAGMGFGLVHWCSQQKGYPGVPLESYTREDMRREHFAEKACAPYCTLQCVHRASLLDGWRHPQNGAKGLASRARAKPGRGA